MQFRLDKSYLLRKEQTEDAVSFRICFADETLAWVALDITVLKSQFKELSQLDPVIEKPLGNINPAVFNFKRGKI